MAAFHARLAEGGAELDASGGRPTVASFGDSIAEHAALHARVGLLDETDRVIVRVAGERARRMLSGLLTNELAPLERGRAVYSFVLTPKGRPVAELRALPSEDGVWLDTPAACAGALLAHLGKYLPPIHAGFEPLGEWSRLALVGPRSAVALRTAAVRLGIPEPEALLSEERSDDPLRVSPPVAVANDRIVVVEREPIEGPGFDLLLPVESLIAAWDALTAAVSEEGGRAAGRQAYEILRVERGVPAYGAEIDLRNLPQETGQEERAISYEKGCYTGQEVVARIHYRGHVNRRLGGLELLSESRGILVREAPLFDGERKVGRVTTAVRSPRFGGIALGYVRREVEPGATLSLAPAEPAAVRLLELPFTST